MNLTQLKKSLPYIFRTSITPVLWGEYAEGKTGVISEYAKDNGHFFFSLNIGTMADIGDLIGVMRDDPEGKFSQFLPPKWLYDANKFAKANKDKYAIILIDEANRSSLPGAFQAIMPIAAERRVHEHALESNVVVVLAMNPAGPKYEVLNFNKDKARTSRFAHIFISSSTEEFLAYNKKTREKGNETLQFLTANPNTIKLSGHVDVTNINEKNQRGWTYVAELEDTGLEKDDALLFNEIGQGLVGLAMGERLKWKEDNTRANLPLEKVLEATAKTLPAVLKVATSLLKREDGYSVATAFASELLAHAEGNKLTKKQQANVRAVLMELHREVITALLHTALTAAAEKARNEIVAIMVDDTTFVPEYTAKHPLTGEGLSASAIVSLTQPPATAATTTAAEATVTITN